MIKKIKRYYWSPRVQRLLARGSVLLGPLLSLTKTPAAKPILSFFARPVAAISALPGWILPGAVTVTAYHTVSGATQITYSPAVSGNTIEVEVGGQVTQIAGVISAKHGSAKSYSVQGTLPPGVAVTGGFVSGSRIIVNNRQLIFSGTASQSGTFPLTIKGWEKNSARGESSPNYTLTFEVINSSGPSISQQPSSTSAPWGGQATFSATVANATGLQWQRNGTPVTDGAGLTGANSSILNLSQLCSADNGAVFTLVVNGSNGSVTSSSAILTVNSTDFQRWRETTFTGDARFNESLSGAEADPDTDKRPNIYEFIYDSSPSAVDPTIPYTTALEPSANAPVLRLEFPRNAAISDTQVVIETSTDFGSTWAELPSGSLTTGTDLWTARLSLLMSELRYVRMRVTNP